jgi:hypothetical protein
MDNKLAVFFVRQKKTIFPLPLPVANKLILILYLLRIQAILALLVKNPFYRTAKRTKRPTCGRHINWKMGHAPELATIRL